MKKLISCFLFSLVAFTVSAQEYGWTDISANIPGSPALSDVFFVSDNEGWISSSSQMEIYHTTDGGETFDIQTTQTSLEAIYMIDASNGYCGGGSGFVYQTIDGGGNWNFHGSMATTLTDMDFASATQGYACGYGGAAFSITPQGVTNLDSGLATDLLGISSPLIDKVWVCGGNNIVHFAGLSWAFQTGPVGTYNAIFFINYQKGWVVGNAGLMGHTINGGETWTSQINPDPVNNSLYDLFFLNHNEGWAVGTQGTILKTTNSGDTWVLDEAGSTIAGTGFLRGVYFTSPTNGYVVGNGNTLLKFSELTSTGNEEITSEFLLLQNYPNPFNPSTTINFSIPKESIVELSIYNNKGQKVKNIFNTNLEKGTHSIVWTGKNDNNEPVGSGIYFAKIKAGAQESVKRMILLK